MATNANPERRISAASPLEGMRRRDAVGPVSVSQKHTPPNPASLTQHSTRNRRCYSRSHGGCISH
uniref:Uncharacterized protein n=1 Tax=mine drainage metagenome TaxID=410659 RepID=E6PWY2_9ZZZZ